MLGSLPARQAPSGNGGTGRYVHSSRPSHHGSQSGGHGRCALRPLVKAPREGGSMRMLGSLHEQRRKVAGNGGTGNGHSSRPTQDRLSRNRYSVNSGGNKIGTKTVIVRYVRNPGGVESGCIVLVGDSIIMGDLDEGVAVGISPRVGAGSKEGAGGKEEEKFLVEGTGGDGRPFTWSILKGLQRLMV